MKKESRDIIYIYLRLSQQKLDHFVFSNSSSKLQMPFYYSAVRAFYFNLLYTSAVFGLREATAPYASSLVVKILSSPSPHLKSLLHVVSCTMTSHTYFYREQQEMRELKGKKLLENVTAWGSIWKLRVYRGVLLDFTVHPSLWVLYERTRLCISVRGEAGNNVQLTSNTPPKQQI